MLKLSKHIGPGFLLAGAAVGVSHLVQSTRAGAEYGWVLIVALIFACLSKYPFLMMGPRYTAATGNHLIEGYKKLGKAQYYTYIFISFGSMFIILSAVTLVTAGLLSFLLPYDLPIYLWSFLILVSCFLILVLGKYNLLDKSMKIIISTLTFLTFFAVLIAAFNYSAPQKEVEVPSLTTATSIAFIVAFMGWMPIPIDASIWHSIWTKESKKNSRGVLSLKEVSFDFNLGYITASFIAVLFFILGVLVMFGSGLEFSNSSVKFSGQLIDLYAGTLGEWTKPIIGFAAFITMFSTTLTVADAFPRVVAEIFVIEKTSLNPKYVFKINTFSLVILSIVALAIIQFGSSEFKLLIDFAAALSFLSAPFLAWFNYQLFLKKDIPKAFRLSKPFKIFSICCLLGLILFGAIYIWSIFLQ
jgi:Mn2+/Fe2+ NRAMP family transporter